MLLDVLGALLRLRLVFGARLRVFYLDEYDLTSRICTYE